MPSYVSYHTAVIIAGQGNLSLLSEKWNSGPMRRPASPRKRPPRRIRLTHNDVPRCSGCGSETTVPGLSSYFGVRDAHYPVTPSSVIRYHSPVMAARVLPSERRAGCWGIAMQHPAS